MTPDFSIVIPFLNEESRLPACLDALAAQRFPAGRFEVLLVDNGSGDASARIVEAWSATREGRARLLHEAQRDPYLARNRGIAAARGAYIVFLDADCVPEPDWLTALAQRIEETRAPVVLGYLAYPARVSPLLRCHEEYYHHKIEYLIEHRLDQYYFGHGGNMAVRREVFTALGDFEPMPIVGDTEIIHRIRRQGSGPVMAYAPAARVTHTEVTTFRHCLRKLYECGQYSQDLLGRWEFQVIPFGLKQRILHRAFRRANWAGRLSMIPALAAGLWSFELGRWSVKQRRTPQSAG